MKKNVIKLNENALRQIVAESVKKVLNEEYCYYGSDEQFTIIADAARRIMEVATDKETYEWAENVKHQALKMRDAPRLSYAQRMKK